MPTLLTSDEFVAGIVSALALGDRSRFVLSDTELDESFEDAFLDLMEIKAELNIVPNFTFVVDELHRDSIALRETLLAARDKKLIALNNPTFHTFDVKVPKDDAERRLRENPVPRDFYEEVVRRHFSHLGTTGSGTAAYHG